MVSSSVRWTLLLGVTAVSLAWLWRGTGVAASPSGAVPAPPPVEMARVPPARVAAPAPVVVAPPPLPYAYVGSWREGDRFHVFLKRGALTFRVTGLNAIDDQYVVVAADEARVSIRYLPLGTVQVLRLERPVPAPAESVRTPSARSDSEAQSEEN